MTTPFPFVASAVLTAAQMNAITTLPIDTKTASYTAVLGDVGKRIVMNVASANTLTINNTIFSVGDSIQVTNIGAGTTTITAGAGVTVSALTTSVLPFQGGTILALSASSFVFLASGGSVKTPRITAFTASGTFTPAAGVTYAVAHIRAGGGGSGGTATAPGTGGTSSVAFASGTISATGGESRSAAQNGPAPGVPVNSGFGATTIYNITASDNHVIKQGDGAYIVAGGAVTPSVGITVTVGAGGTAGTGGVVGGSGYVFIETFE